MSKNGFLSVIGMEPICRENTLGTCERCSGNAALWTELPDTTAEAKYRVYFCNACDHYTWVKSFGVGQALQDPRVEG